MKIRVLASVAALVLALGLFAVAAKAFPREGSIAIAGGSDLSYLGNVQFETEVTSKLKGYEYPMVYVACYQGGTLVYGQLDFPDAVFVLGGGSSEWISRGGGAAECVASLLVYGGFHNIDDPFVASVAFGATD